MPTTPFNAIRAARLRIRLPAGGNSQQSLTVMAGPDDGAGAAQNVLYAKEWSITDDVMQVSDPACFTVSNEDGVNTGKLYPGQLVQIDESHPDVVGGQWLRQFTGRIHRLEHGSDASGGSVILAACYDLGWHLTSCAAQPLLKTNGITFGALCSHLLDPTWGFASTVAFGNALNRSLKQGRTGVLRQFVPPKTVLPFIQVEPGQTPWDVLQTYATREGLLVGVSAQGALTLFRPDYSQDSRYDTAHFHPSKDPRSTQNNMEGRPTLILSIDGMYSESQCWSTVVKPTKVQEAAIANNPNAQYRHDTYKPSTNPLPFNRRSVLMDAEAINQTMRQNRATYAYQRGLFDSFEYRFARQGHASGGQLYVADSMIPISDSMHLPGQDGLYYIAQVRRESTIHGGDMTQFLCRKPFLLDPSLQAQVGGGASGISSPPPARK